MKRAFHIISILALLALAPLAPPLLMGCATKATVDEYHEVLVVNAEQMQVMAFEAVNAFLLYEKTNRDVLWAVNPGIKRAADQLRETFPDMNASFLTVLKRYKGNRSGENRANLNTWIATIEQARFEAYKWMAASTP